MLILIEYTPSNEYCSKCGEAARGVLADFNLYAWHCQGSEAQETSPDAGTNVRTELQNQSML